MDRRLLVRWAGLGQVPVHPLGKRRLWSFIEYDLISWLAERGTPLKKPVANTMDTAINAHARGELREQFPTRNILKLKRKSGPDVWVFRGYDESGGSYRGLVLQRVWDEQFVDDDDGKPRLRELKEMPLPATLVSSPYDHEARFSTKRWLGVCPSP